MSNKDKDHNVEIDQISGVETTGHEWDGLKELNNPAPRWWLLVWLATIIFSIGYWVVYPTWPTTEDHTKGVFGWTQFNKLKAEQAEITKRQSSYLTKFHTMDINQIKTDPAVYEFAKQGGAVVFKDNCAPCHGAGGQGRVGFPNLNDDDWLFGGTLVAIQNTLNVGVRSTSPDTHMTMMPAFGKDGILQASEINTVADYVLTLNKPVPAAPSAEYMAGKALFEANCASCHGMMGEGNRDMGSPRLNDAIWLYGGDKATVVKSITFARAGVMPAWKNRLSDDSIKMAAIYVHSLGGGE